MPDLGDYAGAVLGAYAASGILIALLVVVSVLQARRVRAALRRAEAKEGRSHV